MENICQGKTKKNKNCKNKIKTIGYCHLHKDQEIKTNEDKNNKRINIKKLIEKIDEIKKIKKINIELHENTIFINIKWKNLCLKKEMYDSLNISDKDYLVFLINDSEYKLYSSKFICFDKKDMNKKELLISKPIENFLNKYLQDILYLYDNCNRTWYETEKILYKKIYSKNCYNIKTTYYDDIKDSVLDGFLNYISNNEYVHILQYLIRRIILITKYCLICYKPLDVNINFYKPYICNSSLCNYQYLNLGLNTSIEYEIINNGNITDLLISLFCNYIKIKNPTQNNEYLYPCNINKNLDVNDINELINKIPPISKLTEILKKNVSIKKYLDNIDEKIYPLLRWIILSNKSYIKELNEYEKIENIDSNLKQFKIITESIEKETLFQQNKKTYDKKDVEDIYAFHGSHLYNWHSILRLGLNYDNIINGRSYGNGVYFSLNNNTSKRYSNGVINNWKNSELNIKSCICICKIINIPKHFQSTKPHIVVQNKNWIQLLYLLVECDNIENKNIINLDKEYIKFDSDFELTYNNKKLKIPINYNKIEFIYERTIFPFKIDLPPSTAKIIMKELNELTKKIDTIDNYWLDIDKTKLDNLYQWIIKIKYLENKNLVDQLKEINMNGIILEILFDKQYPFNPPFIRVLSPKFLSYSEGGSGIITSGGSLCLDLLTINGWSSVYTIESLLLQIKTELCSEERNIIIDIKNYNKEYNYIEAIESFKRTARIHNWESPKFDFYNLIT